MRIAIVEDEAIVARRLERMVRELVSPATIVVATTLDDARAALRQTTFDLVFLDLNLNGDDGFRLLEESETPPFRTIVVSAHGDQALRAFEYGVTDFVPKPWSEARLRAAIARAAGSDASRPNDGIVIRAGRERRRIAVREILFIRGADDYAEVHCAGGTVHLHESSLTALESRLPSCFRRVHRSYIANLSRSRGLRHDAVVLADGSLVPVGRTYRDDVRTALGLQSD